MHQPSQKKWKGDIEENTWTDEGGGVWRAVGDDTITLQMRKNS